MEVISVCNKKGGVGKTTVTANLAAALAKLGHKVLAIDADSQMNLTSTLGNEVKGKLSVSELLYFAVAGQPVYADQFISHNDKENLDIIIGSKLLDSAPSFLATKGDGSTVLASVLTQADFLAYDYVLIDCRPCTDLVVVNALAASSGVIIPVEPDEYSMDGLLDLIDVVTQTRKRVNSNLEIYGILLNKVYPRRKLTKSTIADLRETFEADVFSTIIPALAEAPNATSEHRTCLTDEKSRLAQSFLNLAKEVLQHGIG